MPRRRRRLPSGGGLTASLHESFSRRSCLPVVLVAVFGLAVLEDRRPGDRWRLRVRSDPQPQPTKAIVGAGDVQLPGRQASGRRHYRLGVSQEGRAEARGSSACSDRTDQQPACRNCLLKSRRPNARSSERLQARRQELEARAREIDIRESLLKAAEKRIETRVDELKGVEAGIKTANDQKSEVDAARFKGIVTMYESMKPKDAAKIFDRLEMPVLFEIASQVAPRKMSDILGLMQPEAAERLTVELAAAPRAENICRPRSNCPRSKARSCRKSPIDAGRAGRPRAQRRLECRPVSTSAVLVVTNEAVGYRERAALVGLEGDLLCQHDIARGEIAIRDEAPFADLVPRVAKLLDVGLGAVVYPAKRVPVSLPMTSKLSVPLVAGSLLRREPVLQQGRALAPRFRSGTLCVQEPDRATTSESVDSSTACQAKPG